MLEMFPRFNKKKTDKRIITHTFQREIELIRSNSKLTTCYTKGVSISVTEKILSRKIKVSAQFINNKRTHLLIIRLLAFTNFDLNTT
jgi:hypothetical protein